MKHIRDVVIIGKGPAAAAAFREAHKETRRVLLVETCGCGDNSPRTPSFQALARVAESVRQRPRLREQGLYGARDFRLDWKRLMSYAREVGQHETVVSPPAHSRWVTRGICRFTSASSIRIAGETVEAGSFILCPPVRFERPKLPHAWLEKTSTGNELFQLTDLPATAVIHGLTLQSAEVGKALAIFGSVVVAIDRNEPFPELSDPEVKAQAIRAYRNYFRVWENGYRFTRRRQTLSVKSEEDRISSVDSILSFKTRSDFSFLDLGSLVSYVGEGIDPYTKQVSDLPVFLALPHPRSAFSTRETEEAGRIAAHNAIVPSETFFLRQVRRVVWGSDPEVASIGMSYDELPAESVPLRFQTGSTMAAFFLMPSGEILGAEIVGEHARGLGDLVTAVISHGRRLVDIAESPLLASSLRSVVGELRDQWAKPSTLSAWPLRIVN